MYEFLHGGHGVLLDLSDEALAAQQGRAGVDVVRGYSAELGTNALLIRPDGYIAWAAESADASDGSLQEALTKWFGLS